MTIRIHVNTMRDAEKLSNVCNDYPFEMSLHAGKFCADPKSTLGVLAMMYTDRTNMLLDTGDMPEKQYDQFSRDIAEFINKEAQ